MGGAGNGGTANSGAFFNLCIDFEATFDYENWPEEEMDIIQIDAWLTNENGEELKQFETLVSPTCKPFTTKAVADLTGITEQQIMIASTFYDTMNMLKNFSENANLDHGELFNSHS